MFKPIFGVVGALAAVLYCGRLLYYFLDVSGSVEEAQRDGLGPTLLGLGTIGLVLFVVLMVRIVRFFAALPPTGSGKRGGPGASMHEDDGEFDADAAVARYMARRSAEAASGSPAAPSAPERGGPARRQGFGRKIK